MIRNVHFIAESEHVADALQPAVSAEQRQLCQRFVGKGGFEFVDSIQLRLILRMDLFLFLENVFLKSIS